MKSIYDELIQNGIKVKLVMYKGHYGFTFDAWDDENGKITLAPSSTGGYHVSFDGYDTDPHRFGWNRQWEINHYSNKVNGYQPILTAPISQMKRDIRNFFNIVK